MREDLGQWFSSAGQLVDRDGAAVRERRASLARTEQRSAALIRFLADGDNSEYVVTALRDLHAQARTEKAAVAALEVRGGIPISLPAPAEVAAR